MRWIAAALLFVSTAALADGFALTDQDANAIRQICDVARASPAINLETSAGVAQYCLGLLGRIADHKKAVADTPK